MKSVLASLIFSSVSILFSLAPRPTYGAEGVSPHSDRAPFATCPIKEEYSRLFDPPSTIKVNDLYIIKVFQTRAHTADLKNVVAVLTKYDQDVEIPRVSEIYYDGSPTTVIQANNKGDITIPSTAGKTVQVKFCLQGISNKTDWKHDGNDANEAIYVAGPSKKPMPHAPKTQGKWPCKGMTKQVTKSGNWISFPMCSHNPGTKPVYYSYGLRMDQIGSDSIGIDVGIDPQIINKAVVGP